jgi:hypothetical protein
MNKRVWTRTGIVIGAAALVATGFDSVTYAATGSSLLLGKVNRATDTTTLVNTHKGAALKLVARRGQPALAVSNRAKIARLNADTVDGMHGRRLATDVRTFLAGKSGRTYSGGVVAWQTPMPSGKYQVSFRAGIVAQQATPTTPVDTVCGVADLASAGSDHVHVYVASSATFSGQIPAFVSGSEVVRLSKAARPGLICAATGSFSFYTRPHASFATLSSRTSQRAARAPIAAAAARRAVGMR